MATHGPRKTCTIKPREASEERKSGIVDAQASHATQKAQKQTSRNLARGTVPHKIRTTHQGLKTSPKHGPHKPCTGQAGAQDLHKVSTPHKGNKSWGAQILLGDTRRTRFAQLLQWVRGWPSKARTKLAQTVPQNLKSTTGKCLYSQSATGAQARTDTASWRCAFENLGNRLCKLCAGFAWPPSNPLQKLCKSCAAGSLSKICAPQLLFPLCGKESLCKSCA